MPQPLVKMQIHSGVAEVTLNRPEKRNALTRGFIEQIRAAVATVAADPKARMLLLAAEGPAFCAGMDLDEMQERASRPNSADEWDRDTQAYHDLLIAIIELEIPSLAVAQGPAMAGGLGLLLACDMLLASTSAAFGLPEPKRGITAAIVAPLLLHRVGPGAATTMLLSGQSTSCEEARRIGLCHFAADPGMLQAKSSELVASILTGAPQALAATKKLLRDCRGDALRDQMRLAMRVSSEARRTAEAREGLAAFLEKRSPQWIEKS